MQTDCKTYLILWSCLTFQRSRICIRICINRVCRSRICLWFLAPDEKFYNEEGDEYVLYTYTFALPIVHHSTAFQWRLSQRIRFPLLDVKTILDKPLSLSRLHLVYTQSANMMDKVSLSCHVVNQMNVYMSCGSTHTHTHSHTEDFYITHFFFWDAYLGSLSLSPPPKKRFLSPLWLPSGEGSNFVWRCFIKAGMGGAPASSLQFLTPRWTPTHCGKLFFFYICGDPALNVLAHMCYMHIRYM